VKAGRRVELLGEQLAAIASTATRQTVNVRAPRREDPIKPATLPRQATACQRPRVGDRAIGEMRRRCAGVDL
jgi:hypothetical protein